MTQGQHPQQEQSEAAEASPVTSTVVRFDGRPPSGSRQSQHPGGSAHQPLGSEGCRLPNTETSFGFISAAYARVVTVRLGSELSAPENRKRPIAALPKKCPGPEDVRGAGEGKKRHETVAPLQRHTSTYINTVLSIQPQKFSRKRYAFGKQDAVLRNLFEMSDNTRST
jgi:hypothetical protein